MNFADHVTTRTIRSIPASLFFTEVDRRDFASIYMCEIHFFNRDYRGLMSGRLFADVLRSMLYSSYFDTAAVDNYMIPISEFFRVNPNIMVDIDN